MPSPTITFRIDADLKAWLDDLAAQSNCDRSTILQDLLRALQEGRLAMLPASSRTPFPQSGVLPGVNPAVPALVTRKDST
jgi:hypothetical protein